MFRTGMTKGIYENFLRSFQLNRSELETMPFIYVDPETSNVKLLTSIMSTNQVGFEIVAHSMLSEGSLVLLSTDNT
jgi:hypothetical protein